MSEYKIGVTSKPSYRMTCTGCGFTRPTTDTVEINGIAPTFCSCGDVMVPEIGRQMGFFYAWRKKFQQPEIDKMGYVYIQRESGTDTYKIGATRNVQTRIKQIQNSSGRHMEIVYHSPEPFKSYYEAEAKILTKWSLLRLHGEWIRATGEQITKIAADIITLEHGGEITPEAAI